MSQTARMQQWEVHQTAYHTLLDQRRALVDRLRAFHEEYLSLEWADMGEGERRAELCALFSRELDLLQQAEPIWEAADRLLREGQALLRDEHERLSAGQASHPQPRLEAASRSHHRSLMLVLLVGSAP